MGFHFTKFERDALVNDGVREKVVTGNQVHVDVTCVRAKHIC